MAMALPAEAPHPRVPLGKKVRLRACEHGHLVLAIDDARERALAEVHIELEEIEPIVAGMERIGNSLKSGTRR